MNRLKTMMLLAALTALVLGLGQILGGRSGLTIALVFAGVLNVVSYWFSDKLVLMTQGARAVSESEAPELYQVIKELALRINMPMPRVYIVPVEAPNAFATGRNPQHAAVAVTEGLLNLLDRVELRAVIAHELGHVQNRDTLTMTIAATMAGALSHLANMAMWGMMARGRSDRDDNRNPLLALVGMILAPFAAMLIQMAISRTREFSADNSGARLTKDPRSLASALRKIESWSRRIPLETASPATAHLYIINPFSAEGLTRLFSTHPPTEERIRRLEELAKSPDLFQP